MSNHEEFYAKYSKSLEPPSLPKIYDPEEISQSVSAMRDKRNISFFRMRVIDGRANSVYGVFDVKEVKKMIKLISGSCN